MSGEIGRIPILRVNFPLAEGGGLKAGRYPAIRLHDASCYFVVSRERPADSNKHLHKHKVTRPHIYNFQGRETTYS